MLRKISQCFLTSVMHDVKDGSFFELRYGDDDRPFHLVVRPSERKIAVNAMVGGTWGIETVYDYPANTDFLGSILIAREAYSVAVIADGFSFALQITKDGLRAEWPQPQTEGVACEVIPTSRAPDIALSPTGPILSSIPLSGGGLLQVPSLRSENTVALFAEILAHDASWLAMLAASEPGLTLPPPASAAEEMVRSYWLDADNSEKLQDITSIGGRAQPQPSSVEGLDIVVALYNQQAYIVDCITSLLAEAPPNVRVLVVDDGSTDNSVHLLQQFGPVDGGPFQVLAKPNGGCASARNHGLVVSDRTHIAFIDADDMVEPGFYPALFRVAQATGADFVNGGFDVYAEGPPPQQSSNNFDPNLESALTPELIAGETAMRVAPMHLVPGQPSIWRAVYNRSFLDRADLRFPESILAFDDFQFHMRCMVLARDAWFVPGRKYLYRQHPAQDVRQGDARHFGNIAMCATLLRDFAKGRPDQFMALVATMFDVLGWSLRQLPPTLSGAFLTATAQMYVALSWHRGAPITADETSWICHADFRSAFEGELAKSAHVTEACWWLETEPGLSHPNTVDLARNLAMQELSQ